jgi:hypothetical protein
MCRTLIEELAETPFAAVTLHGTYQMAAEQLLFKKRGLRGGGDSAVVPIKWAA